MKTTTSFLVLCTVWTGLLPAQFPESKTANRPAKARAEFMSNSNIFGSDFSLQEDPALGKSPSTTGFDLLSDKPAVLRLETKPAGLPFRVKTGLLLSLPTDMPGFISIPLDAGAKRLFEASVSLSSPYGDFGPEDHGRPREYRLRIATDRENVRFNHEGRIHPPVYAAVVFENDAVRELYDGRPYTEYLPLPNGDFLTPLERSRLIIPTGKYEPLRPIRDWFSK